MADTGAPWNLPYPLATDLVRDGAQAIEDLAEAAATGLSLAGGLVAVKVGSFSGVQTASVGARGSVDINGCVIQHSVQDASNKVLLLGQSNGGNDTPGTSGGRGQYAAAIAVNGALVSVGNDDGGRTRVGAMNKDGSTWLSSVFVTHFHEPGTTDEITYSLRGLIVEGGGGSIRINRTRDDSTGARHARGFSSLVLLEVKV